MAYDMEKERQIEERIMQLERQIAQKEIELEVIKSECRKLEYMQQAKHTMT